MLSITPFGSSNANSIFKLAWMTDLHLDATHNPLILKSLLADLAELNLDGILIGGDTCNGTKALDYILHFRKTLKKKIYFVLGNHEFYHSSIAHLRHLASLTANHNADVHYLSKEGLFELNSSTVLIGHDGWSDARAGNFIASTVSLHDYHLIEELKDLPKAKLKVKLHRLGSEATLNLEKKLEAALPRYSNILILTHTPPFQAATIYDKHISDDNWAPHFICKAMGDMLMQKMKEHPEKNLVVLCGHAHSFADINVLPNLRVIVGESILGAPRITGLVHV
jgi:3',5'-cyclic-AMP phosphodiesterase